MPIVEVFENRSSSLGFLTVTVDEFYESLLEHEATACSVVDHPSDCAKDHQRFTPVAKGQTHFAAFGFHGLSESEQLFVEDKLGALDHARYTLHACRPDDLHTAAIVTLSRPVLQNDAERVLGGALRYLGLDALGERAELLWRVPTPSHPADAELFGCERIVGKPLAVESLEMLTRMLDEKPSASAAPAEPNEEWKDSLERTAKGDLVRNDRNLLRILTGMLPDVFRWNVYSKAIDAVDHDGLDDKQHALIRAFTKASERNRLMILRLAIAADHDLDVEFDLESIANCLLHIAEKNNYNPLIDKLDSLVWDGVHRLDRVFIDYFRCEDTWRTRLLSRRWMLGCTVRAYEPGCKFDNVVVFEGPEGLKKTEGIRALALGFYASTEITLGDKDSKMIAAATWFAELAELDSVKKASQSALKAFLTQQEDFYRPPYGRSMVYTKRICVFVGTTNEPEYLEGGTGNRRIWPMAVKDVDVQALLRDAPQLWAEAVAVYKAARDCPACQAANDTVFGQASRCSDHRWWLDKEEEALVRGEVEGREHETTTDEMVRRWWYGMAPEQRPAEVTTLDVIEEALKVKPEDLNKVSRSTETRVGAAMSKMGFARQRKKHKDGSRRRTYLASPELLTAEKEKPPVKQEKAKILKIVPKKPTEDPK